MSGSDLQQLGQSLNANLARYPIVAVGLPLIGGFISAIPSRRYVKEYYQALQRPSWSPSPRVFAPVWTTLYLSIGYASHLVALHSGPSASPSIRDLAVTGLSIYGVNLVLNFSWSPLFFWKKKIGAALVTCCGLTVSTLLEGRESTKCL